MADAKRYLDDTGLNIYDTEIKKFLRNAIANTIVKKESKTQFPSIGEEGVLYIDKTQNKIYRWESADSKYYVIGSDYSDLDTDITWGVIS